MSIFFFFFSSRRRHTRSTRDWSSDVCSSDLAKYPDTFALALTADDVEKIEKQGKIASLIRSEERRVGKSVDLGGRRIIKKKRKKRKNRGRERQKKIQKNLTNRARRRQISDSK